MLDQHPHAAAVLGAALDGRPAHAYLLHGPAGTGKRTAARDFAAALLARGAADPESARTRVQHGAHPDLTWVAPSGAHEMLRRDVQETVVSAAAHTPFESGHRVFVLERADTMNDEAANALLKTLEEPPPYVVLLLLTDNPSQVLPTISSRCQPVRFDPLPAAQAGRAVAGPRHRPRDRHRLRAAQPRRRRAGHDPGPHPEPARPRSIRRARRCTAARTPSVPGSRCCSGPRCRRRPVEVEAALAEELENSRLKLEHRRRETEFTERARRADRRAMTGTLDHALQLIGLWYRDLACVTAHAEDLVHHTDRLEALRTDAALRDGAAWRAAVELVDDTARGWRSTSARSWRSRRSPTGSRADRAPRPRTARGPLRRRPDRIHLLQRARHDPRHRQVAEPLVVGRDHVPRRPLGGWRSRRPRTPSGRRPSCAARARRWTRTCSACPRARAAPGSARAGRP